MSTRGRSRKKTASKTPARLAQHVLRTDEHNEAILEVSTTPASASSPIVRLAAQAMSPLCAAVAKAAAGVVAAALPSIPEMSTVTSHNLDGQDQQPEDEPCTPRCTSPVHQDDDNLFSPSKPIVQQQPAVHQSTLDEHHVNDAVHSKQQPPVNLDALDNAVVDPPPTISLGRQLYSWVIMRHHPSLFGCTVCVLLLLQLLISFTSHAATSRHHQQQLSDQHAVLMSLQQQLQDVQKQLQHLPYIQSKSMQAENRIVDLFSAQSKLKVSVEQLAGTTRKVQYNLHSMKSSLQQKHPILWQLLSSAAVQDGQQHEQQGLEVALPTQQHSSNSTAEATAFHSSSQDKQQQLELLAGLWHLVPARLLDTIQQEVRQQLTKQLPPVNLAAARCGASIAYHSPMASPATLQLASNQSFSPIKHLVAGLHQVIQAKLSQPASRSGSTAGMPTAGNMVSSVLLGPNAQQLCVPFQAYPAATLEIQLPQPAHITSVTFHHPSAAAMGCKVQPPGHTNRWCSSTASQLLIAYVNSSSCSIDASNVNGSSKVQLCSTMAAAAAAQQPHYGQQDGDSSDRSDVHDVNRTQQLLDVHEHKLLSGAATSGETADYAKIGRSILAHGVEGAQQLVQLQPLGPAAGSIVVPVAADLGPRHTATSSSSSGHEGSRSVLADRLVVQVRQSSGHPDDGGVTDTAAGAAGAVKSSSQAGRGLGDAGGVMCLYRITVQGTPTDAASFC